MHFVMFYHSLVSDWNHGNAHFLRGVVSELLDREHQVTVYEPRDGWSLTKLVEGYGREALRGFQEAYPGLETTFYEPALLDLDRALDGADVVIVHEWSDHELVADIGARRRDGGDFTLLFHDTHHRSVSQPEQMQAYDLTYYDGVLAFGEVISEIYRERDWAEHVWTWHEAADTRRFRPFLDDEVELDDLVWIGNWGDEERTEELQTFLLDPIADLELSAAIHGVRYPEHALRRLDEAGVDYRGWLPNYEVPRVFGHHRMTVHVPRRFYVESLPGIPTIRPFEAMACGIPLLCSPWDDAEGLFRPGQDYLIARDGDEMRAHMRAVLEDEGLARELVESGRETILGAHTCGHRVDELMAMLAELGVETDQRAGA